MKRPNCTFFNFLFSVMLCFTNWCAQAGSPMWTFTPMNSPVASVPLNGTAMIPYMVTNQSKKPHTLSLTPKTGITQVTGEGNCANPFTLNYQESCILDLQVNGSALTGNVVGGPIVCDHGNPLQCYQPSLANSLNVTLVRQNQATVGGLVTGLVGSFVLQNGSISLSVNTDGQFTIPDLIPEGNAYNVIAQTNPETQTCTVSNGEGIMGATNVTDILVTCSENAYTVGGTLTGLVGTVQLHNNGMALSINSSSPSYPNFTFPLNAQGSPYNVTVFGNPQTQTCSVSDGEGIMGGANVTNVLVTCATQTFTLGGAVSGLVGTVKLHSNGVSLTINPESPNFTFPPLAQGTPYNVTVDTHPNTQTCSVTNGSGTLNANTNNVLVNCVSNTTSLSVTARGTIAVGGGITSFTVTNTGSSFVASNVRAVLPAGWGDVIEDSSACTAIAPGGSCNLNFSSPSPYVAQGGIQILGDNTTTPAPTTALAFSIDGNLVYAIDSSTQARVLNNAIQPATIWGQKVLLVGARSMTDGKQNTQDIVNAGFASSAAKTCNNLSPVGNWYLPAICEFGSTVPGPLPAPGCGDTPSFGSLITLGFFVPATIISPNSQLPVMSFSSTQQPDEGALNAAIAGTRISSTNKVGYSYEFKNDAFPVLCTRFVTY